MNKKIKITKPFAVLFGIPYKHCFIPDFNDYDKFMYPENQTHFTNLEKYLVNYFSGLKAKDKNLLVTNSPLVLDVFNNFIFSVKLKELGLAKHKDIIKSRLKLHHIGLYYGKETVSHGLRTSEVKQIDLNESGLVWDLEDLNQKIYSKKLSLMDTLNQLKFVIEESI